VLSIGIVAELGSPVIGLCAAQYQRVVLDGYCIALGLVWRLQQNIRAHC